MPISNSEAPTFAKIKEKNTKGLSQYCEAEIWERDELLSILKFEPLLDSVKFKWFFAGYEAPTTYDQRK